MKTNVKKILALILATVMLFSISACNQTEEKPTTPTAPPPTDESGNAAKYYWEMLNDVSDTSELPDWTGETLEINVWVAGGTQAIFGTISDTNVTFKELERVTGVKFNVEDSYGNGGDSIDAKLPKIIAGGDLPNLIYGWNIDTQMAELFENGYLVDLTDYYNNGDLDQVLELYPIEEFKDNLWVRLNTEDGKAYQIPSGAVATYYDWTGYSPDCYDAEYYRTWNGVPSNSAGINYASAMYIRDDILQKLYPDAYSADELIDIYMEKGEFTYEQIFDIPLKSEEDVLEMFRDIKELLDTGDYKDLNGKPMEVTYGPNSDTDNWDWMQALPHLISDFAQATAYFSYTDMNAKSEDEVVKWAFNSEKYIEFYKLINTMVNEDIISKNSLVDNKTTFDEKYNACHYAVLYGGTRPTHPSKLATDETWSYRPVWVEMKSDLSFQVHNGLGTVNTWGIFEDTLSDNQIDQLIHAINYLYSDVGVKNFLWGPKSAGLFTEDANGNRTFTTEALKHNMLYREDNGENLKYGLINTRVGQLTYAHLPIPSDMRFQTPELLNAPNKERVEGDAWNMYCPGVFEDYANSLVSKMPNVNTIYGTGKNIEGCAEFWTARAGFEAQMKRMLAATPENFEKEMQELFDYAEENGLTDETLKEYNDYFVEINRTYLKAYGVID